LATLGPPDSDIPLYLIEQCSVALLRVLGEGDELGIITPFFSPSVRGNSITVQRIESGLRDQGVIVRVWSLEHRPSPGEILQALEEFTPDLVHGFHVSGDAIGVLQCEN